MYLIVDGVDGLWASTKSRPNCFSFFLVLAKGGFQPDGVSVNREFIILFLFNTGFSCTFPNFGLPSEIDLA